MDDAQLLGTGLREMHASADVNQRQALLQFVRLLQKWNRVYNLTATRGSREIIRRHVFDSLTVMPYIEGRRVIDVGSGAGLPGLVLAILCGEREFVLLDANARKTRFMRQAIIETGLKNARVCQQRVEQYVPENGFDTVVSRAFAPGGALFASVDHLLDRGRVVLMLGREPGLPDLPSGYRLTGMYPARIPGVKTHRHIATVEKGA